MSPDQLRKERAEGAPETAVAQERPPRTGLLGGAALLLMLGNLTGSLLGFARQVVITRIFGANHETDAFFAALVVPQMFYDLVIGAAISAALIPTFTEIVEKRGREALWRTLGSVLALLWLVLLFLVAVLVSAAHPVMQILLRGYHLQGDVDLAAQIARILLPTLFFLGTSAVLLAALYSLRRFRVAAFAPSLYHLGIIAGALALARPAGILALPLGAVAGAAAQAAAQAVAIVKQGAAIRPRLELTPDIRRIIRLYAPVAAGLLISIAGQVIDLFFKSFQATSAITTMGLATTLTQFPIGIAVPALSFAVLPSISSDAAFARMEQFKDTLAAGVRLVLFMTIPAAVIYLVLATPIVSLLYQHGHRFTSANTAFTATALIGYAIQIPFVGLDQMLIFSFYARKDTLTPMVVGVAGVVIYVLSALLLAPRYHILGLALANTIQNSLHALILLVLMFLAIGSLAGRGILAGVARSLAAALVMGATAAAAAKVIGTVVDPHVLSGQAAVALVPIVTGAVLYLALAAALGSPELGMLWRIAGRRA